MLERGSCRMTKGIGDCMERLTRWEGMDQNGPRVVTVKHDGAFPPIMQEVLRKLARFEDAQEMMSKCQLVNSLIADAKLMEYSEPFVSRDCEQAAMIITDYNAIINDLQKQVDDLRRQNDFLMGRL